MIARFVDCLCSPIRRAGRPLAVLALGTALLAGSGCGSNSGPAATPSTMPSDAAATVNGESVSQKDLDVELNRLYGPQVLQTLVDERLILQQAKKDKVTVTDVEVKARMEELKKSPQYLALTKGRRMKDSEIEEKIRQTLNMQKLILMEIPDQEKHLFYDRYKDQLEQAHVYHILVEKKEDASKIAAQLKAGKDFESLAREFSKDEDSKGQGGDLNWITRAVRVDPEFIKVAFSLPLNQASEPIQVKFGAAPSGNAQAAQVRNGWSIIKVVGRKKSYDELKSDIEDQLVAMRQGEFMQRLRVKAEIKTRYDASSSAKGEAPSGAPAASPAAVGSPEASATGSPAPK